MSRDAQRRKRMFSSLLSALGYGIGIVSGVFSFLWFIESRKNPKAKRLGYVFGAVATIILIVTYLVANQPTAPGGRGSGSTPTPNIPTSTHGITPTPSPTPTPCPTPCILYQENSWTNWSYPSDWRVAGNGLLIGNENGSIPAAVAPYTLPNGVSHFAIQAEIAMPEDIDSGHDHSPGFGITACGSSTSNGWQGYRGGIDTNFLHLNGYVDRYAAIDRSDKQLGSGNFDPGTGFRKYYFEININKGTLTLLIDGAPVVTNVVDDLYIPCGSQVGLWNLAAKVIQVKSFEVIEL
jgi:hypothetical protein